MSKIKSLIDSTRERFAKNFGSSFYHDPVIISMATIFALLLVSLLLLLIFRVPSNVSQLPLTYNIIYGVTYSSSWFGLFGYLAQITLLGGLNFMLAWAYFDKERLLSYLIGCVNILLALLMILYVYNLTALVTQ